MLSILIVDDSLDNLCILHDFLKAKSHQITQSSSGLEAWEILQVAKIKYDLVISDYQMPNGNGLWLLDKLQQFPNAPKFILTSSVSDLDEEILKSKGCHSYLQRPIDWRKLELLIQEIK